MRALITSEIHKLFSTKLWLWLLLASIALTALYAALLIGFSNDPDTMTAPLDSPAGQQTLFAVAAGGANTLVAILAAIGITGEFRHRTATLTFLATPRRWKVVAAKLTVYTATGASYAVVCLLIVASIAWPWLNLKGIDLTLLGEGLPATYAGVIADVTIFAVLGVGLGALVRNQVGTVVGLLIYRFVAEPIVTAVPALSDWTAYLPGSASAALTQVSLSTQDYLAPWAGGLVLAGYGLVLAILGARVSMSRDIT